MEPGEQKPVRDRGPRPVDLRVPGRGRRVFRPAAVRPSRPAENTPGEKLPLHPRNPGQRPAGHLCQSRGGARFGGPASGGCCGPGGNRAQRAFRGHLSGKGDQPHGGRGRYAGCTGQRRGVTGTPPQLSAPDRCGNTGGIFCIFLSLWWAIPYRGQFPETSSLHIHRIP